MFVAALIALLITMALTLWRAMIGPTLFDRLLAVNSFGTKTVLLIAVYGFFTGRPEPDSNAGSLHTIARSKSD